MKAKTKLITVIILFAFFNSNEGFVLFKDTNMFVKSSTVITSQKKVSTADAYSDKDLGVIVKEGKTTFRLFTPNAEKVTLVTFENVNDEEGNSFEMGRDEDGVWETTLDGEMFGKFYGYKVRHEDDDRSDSDLPLCIDPYAKAVATYNTYMNPRKSIVVEPGSFDWENDEWIRQDWRDIIVYEMHIRDMTAHESSGSSYPGTYKGLVEKGKRGGIDYIKNLGVNTVELLPAQEFGSIEIPFEEKMAGRYNTWNPYERNHWGYMTAAFFAPEAYYAQDWKELKWNTWMGEDARQINEFKNMVKAFHSDGIAVMMDVVYNHLSEYELGNLKEIDKEYYFRLDDDDNYIAQSGCGNDLRTEAPMMRRMIVESILYWMKEYHIDGFRFDLGRLLDWETIETIIYEAKKINPDVVFVCEPWGGGYDPQGFSLRGWGAWNDQIRNGVKGENPNNGLGWIFGEWYGNNSPARIKSYVRGTLVRDSLGLFQTKEHSVNYLESHDGYTLGDFIRIGTGEVESDEIIKDVDANAKLSHLQLKLNKLGALFLFTSQGMTMIHAGQEYARSKVLPTDNDIPDEHKGMIDHNTYNKDNAVNYINYDHAAANKELFDYYIGLIELRKKYDAFRYAEYEDITFKEMKGNKFALAYELNYKDQNFFVMFNADTLNDAHFNLPKGDWEILVDSERAGVESLGNVSRKFTLDPSTGAVLIKK
ncbi:MAG: pullulanase [Melioribacteraceae bacterium]|nr:pullulanase [Melioribacteraceae bacterium]MCF8356965.1 pullulanase [Melioribacteraceae bacterium]MCF8396318.1 pullulanase [Melioribacteraceae bacterium]MCF8421247.1 pullulanase [Melioribacteraceae bacterium]